MNTIPFNRAEDGHAREYIARVDAISLAEIDAAHQEYQRDRTLVRPVFQAVANLHSWTMIREAYSFPAPTWPEWVRSAVIDLMTEILAGSREMPSWGKRGRLSREATRVRNEGRSRARAGAVARALQHQAESGSRRNFEAAYRAAIEALKDTDAAGTRKEMKDAYHRLQADEMN